MNDESKNKMKLYSYNGVWRGGIVCVANSKEEAIEKMKQNTKQILFKFEDRFIEEYDISEVVEIY